MVFANYISLKNVSCLYDRWNGCNSTLQAAWYISILLIVHNSFTKITEGRSRVLYILDIFDPYGRYRSVTPVDVVRVNRTIFRTINSLIISRTDTIKPAWRVN